MVVEVMVAIRDVWVKPYRLGGTEIRVERRRRATPGGLDGGGGSGGVIPIACLSPLL